MDLAFEILLPADSNFELLQFKQPTFEWDGISYPQGPPEVKFGEGFMLVKSLIPNFVLSSLPVAYRGLDLECIAVSGGGLDLYWSYLRGFVEEEPAPSLSELITVLLRNRDYWVVIFEPDCDRIDVSRAGTIEDIIAAIDYSFKIEKRGFLMWKDIGNTSSQEVLDKECF